MDLETEVMPENERQSRSERQTCDRHETMVVALTQVQGEVKTMREQQQTTNQSIATVLEKISGFESKLLYLAGALGCLSFLGSIILTVLSNLDKIKALLS